MASAQIALPMETAILPARPALRARASYEAAAQTRRTLGWRAPTTSPNSAIMGGLSVLRDRSREATRNNGYADSALDKLVTNIIGTGIKPLSMADDTDFRQDVHALFLQWTDESDADGLLDFYGQQTQVCRTWLEAGECFVRLRDRFPEDGLSVPLQLQVLEPELCPYTHNVGLQNGNMVRAGIEFDRIGRRAAYYFHPVRPGAPEDFDAGSLIRVPADRVMHIYNPLRPGQLRGIPHLTQALVKLNSLDKMDDGLLLRMELSNMFVGFFKGAPTTEDPQLDPLTGQALDTRDDKAMLTLEAGTFQQLDHGEELDWSEPPDPPQSYPDFVQAQLRHIATAAKVPYEVLTGDMSDVNDRTVRVILHEFRRKIQALQHQILAFQLCRPLWKAWMDRAFLASALDLPASYLDNPGPWSAARWIPQAWPYLHPVQDVQAKQAAIRAGFTTRAAEVSEQGEDTESIDAQQAADNARADRLSLKYDSDGRFPASASIVDPEALAAQLQGAQA